MYTIQGKTRPTHTCFSHSVCVCRSIIHISRGPHIATFCVVVNRFEQIHYPREEELPTQSITRWLTDPWIRTQHVSHSSQWSSGEKSSFYWQPTTRLTEPIYHHAISTFNTCSQGPTHRSLTDTGGGYNLEVAGLPHTTPRPFQPMVSTFHLRAPPGL
jgi:hypothetical protein